MGMNDARIEEGVAFLLLRDRTGKVAAEAAVDLDDLQLLEDLGHSWYLSSSTGYVMTVVLAAGRRTTLYLHRVLMGAPQGLRIDHIDHDSLNNRKTNLRIVTASQNNQNVRGANSRSLTGVRNVTYHPNRAKPYAVRLQIHGKVKRFGYYASLEEADLVAQDARRKHFSHAPENHEGAT